MLKTHQNRNQLQIFSLECVIDQDNIIRVIDAFVDAIELEALGFKVKGKIKNGAPAFHSGDLLKLYYYGYLNRVRSSRRLEREAKTNLEAIWLLKGCRPGYKTISNFRKDNTQPLQSVFKLLNQFLLQQDLFDTECVAIDGAKFRAQNSKKNNYNEKKVDQHLKYIEKQTQEYLRQMDELDQVEQEMEIEYEQKMHVAQKLDHLHQRKEKYESLKTRVQQAREAGQSQVSTSDPDARSLPKKMNIVEVSYNVVAAADRKNKLITNFQVLNQSDTYALSGVAIAAKNTLQKPEEFQKSEESDEEQFTVIADKGFDTGHELKACADQQINTIVAPRKRLTNKKNKEFSKKAFSYDEDLDQYTCPKGFALTTNGTWYSKKAYNQHRASYKFQRYTLSYNICKNCPFKEDCVGTSNLNNSKGKFIERSEYEPYIEENIRRYKVSKEIYRQRQAIIEHPFGTIKRQWGFDYTLLKTREKVAGEFAIIFTCYNLRRAISILGVQELIRRWKEDFSLLKAFFAAILSRSKDTFYHKFVFRFFITILLISSQWTSDLFEVSWW